MRDGVINEADTCREFVTPRLVEAGWGAAPHVIGEQRTFTNGRIIVTGGTFDKEYDELTGTLHFEQTHLPEMQRHNPIRLQSICPEQASRKRCKKFATLHRTSWPWRCRSCFPRRR